MIAPSTPIIPLHGRRRHFAARTGPIVAAIALMAATGCCSQWDMRGKGFGDNSGRWAQNMRPPADESQFSGLDSRAREIERNLGVR
jgi:hypothetical protein